MVGRGGGGGARGWGATRSGNLSLSNRMERGTMPSALKHSSAVGVCPHPKRNSSTSLEGRACGLYHACFLWCVLNVREHAGMHHVGVSVVCLHIVCIYVCVFVKDIHA